MKPDPTVARSSFPPILLLSTVALMTFPLWRIVSLDDEGFRNTVVGSTLHGRALLAGRYPFWTSSFGFGMPQPFLTNFNYHPLVFGFAVDTSLAIVLLNGLHLLIGAVGMWLLCKRWHVGTGVSLVCAVSFLTSTPTLQFFYVDFWPEALFTWALLPASMLVLVELLAAFATRDRLRHAVALGLIVAFMLLNGHPSVVLIYAGALGVLALGHPRALPKRLRWFALAGLVFSIMSAGKIHSLLEALADFESATPFKVFPVRFGRADLWSLLLRPLPLIGPDQRGWLGWSVASWEFNLGMGSRGIFYGPPFVLASVASLYWSSRRFTGLVSLSWPFLALCFLYVGRPGFIYRVVSSELPLREPVIVVGLLIAGIGLTRLASRGSLGRAAVIALCFLQVSAVLVTAAPFWYRPLLRQAFGETPMSAGLQPVLADVIRESRIVRDVKGVVARDEGRLFLSPLVDQAVRNRQLMSAGVSDNSLPLHGMRVVNGLFKGVSYKGFCPDPMVMYGALRESSDCRVTDERFFDLTGIKYVLKYDHEHVRAGLVLERALEQLRDGSVGLYRNPSAWPEAVSVQAELRRVAVVPGGECRGGGLVCSDFSAAARLRLPGPVIEVARSFGDITLSLAPQPSVTQVLVTEHYREGWTATAQGDFGIQRINVSPVLGQFMVITLPSRTRRVLLRYRPIARVCLEIVSLTSLLGSAVLVLTLARKTQRSEAAIGVLSSSRRTI